MKYLRDTSGEGEEEEQLTPKRLIVCEHQKIQSITTLALASMATTTTRQIWHPKIKLQNGFYHKQKWEGERLKASLVTVVVLAALAASMWPPASCLVSLASAASCLVFGGGGGLVAVVAKASVVVTFFFGARTQLVVLLWAVLLLLIVRSLLPLLSKSLLFCKTSLTTVLPLCSVVRVGFIYTFWASLSSTSSTLE